MNWYYLSKQNNSRLNHQKNYTQKTYISPHKHENILHYVFAFKSTAHEPLKRANKLGNSCPSLKVTLLHHVQEIAYIELISTIE